jgi:hypothetical protein
VGVGFLLLAPACAGGGGASSNPSSISQVPPTRDQEPAGLPRPSGRPLLTRRASLVGHVRGTVGGYTSLIVVTDASRSEPRHATKTLITLAGIGRLQVHCTTQPKGRFILTSFAAGEGPPTVTTAIAATHGQSLLPGYTRKVPVSIPTHEARHQRSETWQISGGGEAFQFTATITDLLTPTTSRCDLLAQATVVTHGPFYRYAHGEP